ncbi:unnamed protein product [Leuciscus chuanchicus]
MEDQIYASRDQKSLQSISRSVEVIDLKEPPVDDPEVLPAAEPLVQKELQTQVHDAPVRLTAGETSPLTIHLDRNQVNMRPEDNICCRYAIGRKLGQGGFGAVYEGTRLVDGQKHFSHCLDVFDFVGRNGGSIDEKFVWLIMCSATLASDACCRRGVYHSNIKLENLLINFKKLDVKLIDFGCGDLLTELLWCKTGHSHSRRVICSEDGCLNTASRLLNRINNSQDEEEEEEEKAGPSPKHGQTELITHRMG